MDRLLSAQELPLGGQRVFVNVDFAGLVAELTTCTSQLLLRRRRTHRDEDRGRDIKGRHSWRIGRHGALQLAHGRITVVVGLVVVHVRVAHGQADEDHHVHHHQAGK